MVTIIAVCGINVVHFETNLNCKKYKQHLMPLVTEIHIIYVTPVIILINVCSKIHKLIIIISAVTKPQCAFHYINISHIPSPAPVVYNTMQHWHHFIFKK